ncbi:MAG: HAMP domain-containing protein [Desulfovibrio sp.]|nr:MAG: HAMP domain-containing protein [Desulfovibrio sp.]
MGAIMRMSKIFRKTLVLMFLLFGVISISATVLTVWTLYSHMTEEYTSKGRVIARAIANSSVEILLNRDLSTMQSIIDQFLEIQGVEYVFVVDGSGEFVSHTFVPMVPEEVKGLPVNPHGLMVNEVDMGERGEFIDTSKPILAGVAGYVHVGMDKGLIRAYVRETVIKMQALLAVIFWGSVLLLFVVVKKISQPLTTLTEYAGKLADHDFTAEVKITSRDEVGLLANTMQSMAQELSELITGLERAVANSTMELQDTLTYTSAIIDNVADGLLVVDTNGKITRSNPALATMFDFGDVELAGRDAKLIFSPQLAELALLSMEFPGKVFSAEVALPEQKTAKATAASIHKIDVDDDTGEAGPDLCMGAVIIVRDITVEKEIDQMKTNFITTVSHELRTPLTGILGFAKLIKKKLVNVVYPQVASPEPKVEKTMAQVGDNMDVIVSEGERLTELINDVLDISKMEAGKTEWRRHRVYMAEVIDKAVQSTKALYTEKSLPLNLDIEDKLPEIIADRDRLIQVLVNLISNAVKFTEQGSITIKAAHVDEFVQVSVEDTGVGIAAEDQQSIFERFKQIGDTLTEKPKGTGLGLAICKQIIEHHGGDIWLESIQGRGSTFYFSMPVRGVDVGLDE